MGDFDRKLRNLDSFLLFLTTVFGFSFSLIWALLSQREIAYGFFLLLIIGLAIPIYIGYVRGGIVLDTLEERVRGWIYFLYGVTVYVVSIALGFVSQLMLGTVVEIFSGLLAFTGTFLLSYYLGVGKLRRWFCQMIFKIFDREMTKVTEKIYSDTARSAFYTAVLLYAAFAVSMFATSDMFTVCSVVVLISLAIALFAISERIMRKWIELLEFSKFIEIEYHPAKFFIPVSVGKVLLLVSFLALASYLVFFRWIGLILKLALLLIILLVGTLGTVSYTESETIYLKKKEEIPKSIEENLRKLLAGIKVKMLTSKYLTEGVSTKKNNEIRKQVATRLRTHLAKNIVHVFLTLGFLITLLGGLIPLYLFYNAPSHTFQPNFSGFGIARNGTSISPQLFVISVTIKPPELYFHYSFVCSENGTYNFLFWFPFEIISRITSTVNMSLNTTSQGSAVWLRHQVDNVHYGWADHHFSGVFLIKNTFQSGTRGSYMFVLPFGLGIPGELIRNIQRELGVAFTTAVANIDLSFGVPEGYHITQTFPPHSIGPNTWITPSNRTITKVGWNPKDLKDSVTIYCQNPNEIALYESFLFIGGLCLGIGVPMMTTPVYDVLKKWARIGRCNNEQEKKNNKIAFLSIMRAHTIGESALDN